MVEEEKERSNAVTDAERKLKKLLSKEPNYVVPGTKRYQELESLANSGIAAAFSDAVQNTAFGAAAKIIEDEAPGIKQDLGLGSVDTPETRAEFPVISKGADIVAAGAALFGMRSGPVEAYLEENYESLVKDIPARYHDEITNEPNLAAATRARNRVLGELDRAHRMSTREGLSSAVGDFAGSLIDFDLPLIAVTGGGFKAAKVAGKALHASKNMGLSPSAATRVASGAVGVNAGAQAGFVTGLAQQAWSETKGWTEVAESTIAMAAFGGGINFALKGDIGLSIKKAREELHKHVRQDNPNLNSEINPEAANIHSVDLKQPESASAAVNPDAPSRKKNQTFIDPMRDTLTPDEQSFFEQATKWRDESGWELIKEANDLEFWSRVAVHPTLNLTTNDFMSLYTSKSAAANFLAGNVFESANGLSRGNYTAAANLEPYTKRIVYESERTLPRLMQDYAREHGYTFMGTGRGITDAGKFAFHREVALELNSRLHGRESTASKTIKEAADARDKSMRTALDIGKGLKGQKSIDGFENLDPRAGYFPYMWNGARMATYLNKKVTTKENLVKGLASGYVKAGITDSDTATVIAKALVNRALSRNADIDTNLINLLDGDGREFLRETLLINNVKDADADALIDRLTGRLEEKGREGFAKSRNDIDISETIETLDGSNLQIVDLFNPDAAAVFERYARRVAGAAALARVGITNRKQRETVISVIQAEQRALGENVIPAGRLRAMFSNFNGGPQHGYAFGRGNEGVGPVVSTAKRLTSLALLPLMGITQIAETGAIAMAVGVENFLRKGVLDNFNLELRKNNSKLLEEVHMYTGEIGRDQSTLMEIKSIDDVAVTDQKDYFRTVDKYMTNAQWLHGYTSLFNQVRSWQQKVATAGIINRILVTVRNESVTTMSPSVEKRFREDLGLFPEDIRELSRLINDSTIEFKESGNYAYVNRLNMSSWDGEFGEKFAQVLQRNMNQVVQRSMAGESDVWMSTEWGALLTQLKGFPLQAIQKQFIRNMRHSDPQAVGTVLLGMTSAVLMLTIRDAIQGRDPRDPKDMALAAFNYANMTGWVPMFTDPTMSILGLEDYRLNPYGPHSDYTPAAFSVATGLSRAPGAIVDKVTGQADWHDSQSIRLIPFVNSIGLGRLFNE